MSDRGAALMEYAIGIALIAIVAIAGIQSLEESSEETLDARGDVAGTPIEEYGYLGLSGAGTSPGTSTSTTSTTAPSVSVQVLIDGSPSSSLLSGKKWSATVTFQVLDDGGSPVTGAVITGTWTIADSGPTTLETECSSITGTCAVVANKIDDAITEATFQVTSVTGDGISLADGGALPSVTALSP